MYIDKWWGTLVGGTDDSLSLIDFFTEHKNETLKLSDVLEALGMDKYLGVQPLYDSTDTALQFDSKAGFEVDFQISIDPIIDLSCLLVEQIQKGKIFLSALDGGQEEGNFIIIDIDQTPLTLLIDELSEFHENFENYDLASFVPEEDMEELAGACAEISDELKDYLNSMG